MGRVSLSRSDRATGWIDDDAELAAVSHGEEQGVVAVEGRQAAAGRTRRRLRLHHLGAQVGQEPPAQLAEVDGQVDHPEAGQGSNGHGSDVTPRRPREWREAVSPGLGAETGGPPVPGSGGALASRLAWGFASAELRRRMLGGWLGWSGA